MPAEFAIHLPEPLIAEAGGLQEGDVIRYVKVDTGETVLVVKVIEFRDNWYVLKDDRETSVPIVEARVQVLPETAAQEATLRVQVDLPPAVKEPSLEERACTCAGPGITSVECPIHGGGI